jgi:hypothetical protein
VVDEQVEHLTAGAAKALTSLGGLLSGVARGGWSVGQIIASKVSGPDHCFQGQWARSLLPRSVGQITAAKVSAQPSLDCTSVNLAR